MGIESQVRRCQGGVVGLDMNGKAEETPIVQSCQKSEEWNIMWTIEEMEATSCVRQDMEKLSFGEDFALDREE